MRYESKTDLSLRNLGGDFGLRMLGLNDTATLIGLSPITLRAMIRAHLFPEPVRAHRRDMWAISTVREWAEGKWRPAGLTTDDEAA